MYVRVDKCKSSGARIHVYAKNVIVNNTPFRFRYQYESKDNTEVAGQGDSMMGNTVMMVNNVNKVYLSVQDKVKATRYLTESLTLEQLTFNNKVSLKVDDNKFYELHTLTALSPTISPQIQTKITTIHPSQVLVNLTNFMLSVLNDPRGSNP